MSRPNFLDLCATLNARVFPAHTASPKTARVREAIRDAVRCQGRMPVPEDAEVDAALGLFWLWRAGLDRVFDLSLDRDSGRVTLEGEVGRVTLSALAFADALAGLDPASTEADVIRELAAADVAEDAEEERESLDHERGCACERCEGRRSDEADRANDREREERVS